MDIQLYTPREIKTLTSGAQDTSYIDTIKVRVAERTEAVEEWSHRYMTATRILKALTKVAAIDTDDTERTWFVPKSPSRLFMGGGKDTEITTLKYCGSREESTTLLEAVFDRPRRELLDFMTILGAGTKSPEGELSYLRYEIGPDMNQRYIRLTWASEEKPEQMNVIYLHRGSKEKKK